MGIIDILSEENVISQDFSEDLAVVEYRIGGGWFFLHDFKTGLEWQTGRVLLCFFVFIR